MEPSSTGGRLARELTPADRRPPADFENELERVVVERAEAGGAPGGHGDGRTLALVVEGGGMGGTVSGGMCVGLEALGLINSFDLIVACSSGALNGAWAAAGQAAQGTTHYQDLATREFMNPWRLMWGKPPINFGLLFNGIAMERKPLSPEAMAAGPRFACIATSVTTGELHAFTDFETQEDLLLAIRASCSLPVLAGPPIEVNGDRYVDGGVIESMPYNTAFRLGATHVLVLRSREPEYRKTQYSRFELRMVAIKERGLLEAVRARPGLYNREAEELESVTRDGRPDLRQITPLPGERVAQMERDPARLAGGVRAGTRAVARIFAAGEVDLLWQPRPYLVG